VLCVLAVFLSRVNPTHASENYYLKYINNSNIIARMSLFVHVCELCIDIDICEFSRGGFNLEIQLSKSEGKAAPVQALRAHRGCGFQEV
jgi:hypothetical protein